MRNRTIALSILTLSLLMVAPGCKKKVKAPSTTYTPPVVSTKEPAASPQVMSFTAEPVNIQRGESSTLKWNVVNATEISIDGGVGPVQASGTRQVFPNSTTTYFLTAKGPGGSTSASVAVTVISVQPPPTTTSAPVSTKSIAERMQTEVQDVYFDYDKSEVREDGRAMLHRNADALKAILKDFPNATILMEGHCDERGSAEYNLGLGDRRVSTTRDFLTQIGVPAANLKTVSYGKEKPQCMEASESCYQKNRRVHFAAQ
jgi:peptidoglycan-associated lipoprotein